MEFFKLLLNTTSLQIVFQQDILAINPINVFRVTKNGTKI